jgi:replicative DNA helicase
MNKVIPNIGDIEKRVLSKSLNSYRFFRDFNDTFGRYTFGTPIRRIIYKVLVESKDGTDIESLLIRRKNEKYFRKLVRVYKLLKKRKVKDSDAGLISDFKELLRINENIETIKQYVTQVKSGEFNEANKTLEYGLKTVKTGLLEELEVGDNLDEELDHICSSEKTDLLGRWGYKYIDMTTGGIWNGDFNLIFGRPGVGKSIFLLNVAHKNRIRGNKFAIITLEMPASKVRRRYLSRAAVLDYKEYFKFGRLEKEHKERIKARMESTGTLGGKIYLIGVKGDCTLGIINSIIRRYKVDYGVNIFGIDFIDCINSGSKAWSEQHELGVVAKGLKIIALDHDVGIIGITHMNLSRGEEIEEDGRAKQGDIGYSQRKTQYCDNACGMIASNRDKEEGLISFSFVKARDAESDIFFKLKPDYHLMRFNEPKSKFHRKKKND